MPIDYKIRNLRRLFGESSFLRPSNPELSAAVGKMAKHYARKVWLTNGSPAGAAGSADGAQRAPTTAAGPGRTTTSRTHGSGSQVRQSGGGPPRIFFAEQPPRSMRNKAVAGQLFASHLFEKQKMKLYYGALRDDQFRRYVQRARARRRDTDAELLGMLEMRLDTVFYRSMFVKSPGQARQWLRHGALRVNGQRVDVKGHAVSPGDIITVADKWTERVFAASAEAAAYRKQFGCGASWIVSRFDPVGMLPWLEIDREGLAIFVVREPTNDEMRSMTRAALFPFIRDANLNPHAAMRAYI